MIRLQRTATYAGLLAGSLLALSVGPAQAFSFFPFTTNFTGSDPKGDITLDSVVLPDSTLFSKFSLVNSANIISNDPITDPTSTVSGAASADLGDNATVGLKQEAVDNAGVVAALGNLSLSSIIDTEDKGSFVIDLGFQSPVDNLFFWERGANSKLSVQALDSSGNVTGNLLTLSSAKWAAAGYSLDTTEIDNVQPVTSLGLSLDDLGVNGPISGIRVSSDSSYNGPDFKIVGATAVPEPITLSGLGLVAGIMAVSRRKSAKQA